MGYGAMQLAGPGVWGPPRDLDVAIAVLREAVSGGVNHIDTSDFYGPHVTNQSRLALDLETLPENWPGICSQKQRERETEDYGDGASRTEFGIAAKHNSQSFSGHLMIPV
jgi:hypothetical protein